jgi:hypothetical protein
VAYRIYVNGQLMNTETRIKGLPLSASLPWKIGGVFSGQLDEVRVWNTALPMQQIRDDMNRPLTGNEPGLVNLWNFESVTNGIIKDRASGGHDGSASRARRANYSGRSPIQPAIPPPTPRSACCRTERK